MFNTMKFMWAPEHEYEYIYLYITSHSHLCGGEDNHLFLGNPLSDRSCCLNDSSS